MPRRIRTAAATMSAIAGLTLIAACTTQMDGTAHKATGSAPTGVQTALLNHGNYPTTPRPALGTVTSPDAGRALEAARMANFVTLPNEVDPVLVKTVIGATSALPTTASLGTMNFLPSNVAAAAGAHQFVLGFSSDRQSTDGPYKQLQNMVLEFPDAAAASAAATDMSNQYAHPVPLADGLAPAAAPQSQPIPDHPDTIGLTSPVDHFGTALTGVTAFTAHGQYVLIQDVMATDVNAATALVAAALTKQSALIDRFIPTDPARLATLPADPTGLLARTLPPAQGDDSANSDVVYEPRAFLHFTDDPSKLSDALQGAGVRSVAVGQSTVYEAADAAGAQSLADTEVGVTRQVWGYDTQVDGVNGYPAARCYQHRQTDSLSVAKYYCAATAENYLIEASAQQIADVHAQLAAQYLLLTTK